MTGRAGIGHALEATVRLWALAAGLVLLSIVAVTTVNVGAFALDRLARLWGATVEGLPGYEDYVRLAISGAALMFFPYCQMKRGHVVVHLFTHAVPGGLRRGLDRLWLAAIGALALFLAWWMLLGLLETRADGALSRVLGWPEWPFYLPGLVSLLIWAAVAFRQAVVAPADAAEGSLPGVAGEPEGG